MSLPIDRAAVDVSRSRLDDGHALGHPVVEDPGLHDSLGHGEMLPRIDAQDVVGVQDVERDHLAPHRLEPLGGVGEVVFALGVAGADLFECFPEAGQLEDVTARIDLGDRALLGSAIALLDDPEKAAGRIAKDTAEAGRIVKHRGAQQTGGLVVMLPREQITSGWGRRSGSSPTRIITGPR